MTLSYINGCFSAVFSQRSISEHYSASMEKIWGKIIAITGICLCKKINVSQTLIKVRHGMQIPPPWSTISFFIAIELCTWSIRAHSLYSTIDRSSDELESGPTGKILTIQLFFLFSPPTCPKVAPYTCILQVKKMLKIHTKKNY